MGGEEVGREGPAGRLVFAGKHDDLVGDIEGERREREIGEGDALGENHFAVAVVARQAGGAVFGNGALPMLERFGGDLALSQFRRRIFSQRSQPCQDSSRGMRPGVCRCVSAVGRAGRFSLRNKLDYHEERSGGRGKVSTASNRGKRKNDFRQTVLG